MATYYVDYENVHNSGMKGIEEVGNKDLVYVLYSAAANTMTMETIKKLLHSTCAIEFVEVNNGPMNSLDFQLITLLYATIDNDDCHYIISGDKGYDASITMAKRLNINSVMRFPTIYGAAKNYENRLAEYAEQEALTDVSNETEVLQTSESTGNTEALAETVETAIISAFTEKRNAATSEFVQNLLEQDGRVAFSQEKLDITCECISKASTKMELYKSLRHDLGDKEGRLVYGVVCDSWGELVALAS